MTDKATGHPDEQLPWYVNGTLNAAERAEVNAHLADCKRCRSELAFLTSLHKGVRAMSEAPEAMPGDLALNRLLREVRNDASAAGPHGLARRWWRPALAAAAVVIIAVQGLVITRLYGESGRLTPLSGPTPAGAVVQIRFNPSARESEIRAALQAVNGRFISGPGALGVYRVRLDDLAADAPVVAKLIAELRARHGVVDYVTKD